MPEYKLQKPATYCDHMWLVNLRNDPEVLKNVTDPSEVTIARHMLWYDKLNPATSDISIFYVDSERAGIAKLNPIDFNNKSVVMGADLHKDFRGKGLAKEMWHLMIEKATKIYGCHRLSLTTAEYNEVAQYVYMKLGFKKEGRLVQSLYRDGKFYDQICMYKLATDDNA